MYRKYIAFKYNLFSYNYIGVNFLRSYLNSIIKMITLRDAKDNSLEKQYDQYD